MADNVGEERTMTTQFTWVRVTTGHVVLEKVATATAPEMDRWGRSNKREKDNKRERYKKKSSNGRRKVGAQKYLWDRSKLNEEQRKWQKELLAGPLGGPSLPSSATSAT